MRQQIWELYQDFKAYRQEPDEAKRSVPEARFDELCANRTNFPSVDGVLKL